MFLNCNLSSNIVLTLYHNILDDVLWYDDIVILILIDTQCLLLQNITWSITHEVFVLYMEHILKQCTYKQV